MIGVYPVPRKFSGPWQESRIVCRDEGEHLFLLAAATQAYEHQGYLDGTQVQVMTGRNAERKNTRENYAGESRDLIAKNLERNT